MNYPLVSIVVPCYNHEKYIEQCIQSIIDQDYDNIELIIIDDGSSDGSFGKIQQLADKCKKRFVRFEFRTRPNQGLCATLNEAIDWCEGGYYSTIASDDMMLPHKTSKQVHHFIKNPNCDAVFGGINIVDDLGKIIRKIKSKSGSFGFRDLILVRHSLSAPTQMIRLSCLKAAGKYLPSLYIEDWYMWLKLASLGARIDDISDILVNYRRHDSNISGNFEKMKAAREQIIAQYKHHPLYVQAKATANLTVAIDAQAISKTSSIKYAITAISISPAILMDKRFYRYLLKFLVPSRFIGQKKA